MKFFPFVAFDGRELLEILNASDFPEERAPSYCDRNDMMSGRTGWWIFLFMLSKTAELFDTVFIVLRKKPLLFLHWYHHVLMLMFGVSIYPHAPAFIRWGATLNFIVHSLMYSYFFARAMNWRLPGWVARSVTTAQITQFILSCLFILLCCYELTAFDMPCDVTPTPLLLALAMEASYLVLFIRFFQKAYGSREAKKIPTRKEQKEEQQQPSVCCEHCELRGRASETSELLNGDIRKRA